MKDKKISITKTHNLFLLLLLISTLVMGVGYASINSILLDFSGNVEAKVQEGIFITDYKCYQSEDNNLCNTDNIISNYQTTLHSDITLENNINSTITYQITVYNSSDSLHYFNNAVYINEENTYSNENITYELKHEDNKTPLQEGTELPGKTSLTFNITFKFKDNADITNNTLKSYINFKFLGLYNVTFNPKGGTVDTTNKTVTYTKTYGELPTPTKFGYTFNGWYTKEEDGQLIESTSTVTTNSNHTLYAHWNPIKYSITYKANNGLTLPNNPTNYDVETNITLANPQVTNKLGYRINWTEEISTSNWKNGFINLSTGAYEEYNSTYPDAVISEKIYLKADITYIMNGIDYDEFRWRFFSTTGEYLSNSQRQSFTPTQDGYVIILIQNGATESVRNNLKITSYLGNSVTIDKGTTGNKKYTVSFIPTKILLTNMVNNDQVTIKGNTPTTNSDGSISFNSSKKFNNMIINLPQVDYSSNITAALDVYISLPSEYNSEHSEIQALLLSRAAAKYSFFLFQWSSRIYYDLGGSPTYRNILTEETITTGRYLFIFSYSTSSNKVKKTIIINKSTGEIIYNNTDKYSLEGINTGINAANYELQIGGDFYQTNEYPYDADPTTKFYSYFFDNIGMTNDEIESLIAEFGYGNIEIS